MTAIWFIGIAIVFYRVRQSRLQRKTTAVATTQLSSATDMLSVLLLSGMTTPQALQQLHHYLDEPCRTVFHDCSQLLSHGSRFHDVVRQLSSTFGSPHLHCAKHYLPANEMELLLARCLSASVQ